MMPLPCDVSRCIGYPSTALCWMCARNWWFNQDADCRSFGMVRPPKPQGDCEYYIPLEDKA